MRTRKNGIRYDEGTEGADGRTAVRREVFVRRPQRGRSADFPRTGREGPLQAAARGAKVFFGAWVEIENDDGDRKSVV